MADKKHCDNCDKVISDPQIVTAVLKRGEGQLAALRELCGTCVGGLKCLLPTDWRTLQKKITITLE